MDVVKRRCLGGAAMSSLFIRVYRENTLKQMHKKDARFEGISSSGLGNQAQNSWY